jgi:hypothetical protein
VGGKMAVEYSKGCRMIRSKTRMGILLWILTLALHVLPGVVGSAQGQGSRKDDIVFNSRGVPLAGATVRVCAMPATGQPCTPLANIYSDPLLTQALSNPTTTDGMGNYSFYAAPGKYEIEISGPGITTKQLPNVILPSDPSSPTFSSLSSTGGISAFTLSLTGNLTVNGSTTVVGNMASGTLSLSNQSTPPGTPAAGSVNLYTKTLDKRLYYKDETGTEVGPLATASGAQTNTPNTFTAQQTFNADVQLNGPNPYYDLRQFGWYVSSTYYKTGTTGSMSASSSTLSLTSALDFQNGEGVVVLGAGPTPTISTPTTVTAAAVGATGSTTYYYCVVDEDYYNGRTACSAAGSVTNAVATLGIQTYTITAASRSSGVVTVTAANTIISGSQIEIQNGTTGQYSFEGAFTSTSASSSAITYNQYGQSNASGTVTSGNLRVVGAVAVKWQAPSAYTVLKHFIYRCTGASCALPTNAANYNLVGVATGQDSYFLDRGYTVNTAYIDNGDTPQTAPTSTSNGWLATTIVSGGGTTTLTLAASATNAVSGTTVKHDNAPVIKAACAAIPANTGQATFRAPSLPSAGAYGFAPFSSFFSFTSGIGSPASATCMGGTTFEFNGALWLNAPIQLGHQITLRGTPGGQLGSPSGYFEAPLTEVTGVAYPMFYINAHASGNDFLANLEIICNGVYQSCVYEDEASNGDGGADFRYDDVDLNAGGYSNAYVAKAGFGRWWTRGIWQTGANDFSSPTAALFSPNCGTGQPSGQASLPAIGYTYLTSLNGGLLVDNCGGMAGLWWNHWSFTELLMESGYIPAIRVNNSYGLTGISVLNLSYADVLGGYSTPLIDLTNSAGNANIVVTNASCATGYQPILEVGTSTNYQGLQVNGTGGCSVGLGANNGIAFNNNYSFTDQLNWSTRLQNASHVAYQMAVPGAPQSAVVSSGGAVPVGTHSYQVTAVDPDGNETLVGPAISATTTSGNQTVTVTTPATFPSGGVGFNVYRDSGEVNPSGGGCSVPEVTTPGGTLVDNYTYLCNYNTPYYNAAGASLLSSNGVSTYKVRAGLYADLFNCTSSSGSCSSATAGAVTIAASATTVTVSTTAVTANSDISVTEDSSMGTRLGVTCNTTLGRTYAVTAKTAGTSFVITASSAPSTNPACLAWSIRN